MTKQASAYESLAAYLAPDDPDEGERQIDAAILTLERARVRPYNRSCVLFWISQFLLLLSATVLCTSLTCWLVPAMQDTFYGVLANVIPLWAAKIMFIGTFLHFVYRATFGASWYDRPRPLPQPPEPIREWLSAQGKSNLGYWAELYWPIRKRRANRKEVLGLVIWRKTPCPPDRYPPVPPQAKPEPENPHQVYLDTPQGRADEAAYLIAFEHRVYDWWRFSFRVNIAMLIVLMIASWLPIYPQTEAGQLIKIGIVLAFTAGCALLFYRGSMPMRWLPYPVRRYWFRSLPPEATRFRDHMIALGY